ncbi:FmdB family zinc ribbon protein [Chloroflexota bacterium]
MPIYEYKCEKCSTRFDLRKRFGQNGDAQCPECASEARRIFTPVPIIFKGSGFYITDSRKNNHQEDS